VYTVYKHDFPTNADKFISIRKHITGQDTKHSRQDLMQVQQHAEAEAGPCVRQRDTPGLPNLSPDEMSVSQERDFNILMGYDDPQYIPICLVVCSNTGIINIKTLLNTAHLSWSNGNQWFSYISRFWETPEKHRKNTILATWPQGHLKWWLLLV
jgi:hypothetical protein